MLDNVMLAIETVTGSGACTNYCTQQQYKNDVFTALYARELRGDKAHHRITTTMDYGIEGEWYISKQTYGNGTKSVYELYTIPRNVGYYEKSVIKNAYRVERLDDNGHELFKFYAVIDDEIRYCIYDMSFARFI